MKGLSRFKCFVIAGSVALTSCGGSGMPSCTDSAVTNTALELLADKIDEATPFKLPVDARLKQLMDDQPDIKKKCAALNGQEWNQCSKKAENEWQDKYEEAKDKRKKRIISDGMENIRVVKKDEDTKKITCAGNANGVNILYTGQRTEDDKVYVEAGRQ